MIIKFLKNFDGSDDGITLKRFKAEGTYTVPSDLSFNLAKIAIDNNFAVKLEVDKKPEPITELKEDEEIIYIDEDLIDEPIKEEKKDFPFKFVKNNKNKK